MSLKREARNSFVWSFVQQISTQLIGFAVVVFLGRLLSPKEFGLMGMIYLFIGIGSVILEGGLAESLIRSKNCDERDYTAVFYFNLSLSILLFLLSYVAAPFIAALYNESQLTDIIRLYSVSFIIFALSSIQTTYFIIHLKFRLLMAVAVPATLVSGIVGVVLAYLGYGVWSLVWSGIVKGLISMLLLWYLSPWRPGFYYSKRRAIYHFRFGYKLALNEIINVLSVNLYPFFIGKYFGSAQVGLYTQSETVKQVPVSLLFGVVNKITYPLLMKVSDDKDRLLQAIKNMGELLLFCLLPLMLFIAVNAELIIRVILGKQWLGAAPYLALLAIMGVAIPIKSLHNNVFKVLGKSDIVLKNSFIEKVLLFVGILITFKISVAAMLISKMVVDFFGLFLQSHQLHRLTGYSVWQQLGQQRKNLVTAIPIVFVLFFLKLYIHTSLLLADLLLYFLISAVFYLFLHYFANRSLLVRCRGLILE